MAAVRQFIEAFNAGDVDGALAACTDDMTILDDFPPHEWAGRGAGADWFGQMARLSEVFGMSDIAVAAAEPRHIAVTDDRAYVVIPVVVRWLDHGAPADRGGSMTLGLRAAGMGWRISTLAWTWD